MISSNDESRRESDANGKNHSYDTTDDPAMSIDLEEPAIRTGYRRIREYLDYELGQFYGYDFCEECQYPVDDCRCPHCTKCGEKPLDCVCEICEHCLCRGHRCACEKCLQCGVKR